MAAYSANPWASSGTSDLFHSILSHGAGHQHPARRSNGPGFGLQLNQESVAPRRWPRRLATVRMNKSSTEIQGLLSDSSGGQPSPDVLQSSGGRRGCGVRGRQLVLRSPLGQGEPVPKEGASCVRPAAREWLRDHREKYENFLGNRTGIEGCRKKTHCGRV